MTVAVRSIGSAASRRARRLDIRAAAALLAGSLPVIVVLRRRGPHVSDRVHARWYVGLLVVVTVAMTAALLR